MSKIWQPKPNETLQYWLDTILDEAVDDLTEWEANFIDSVGIRITRKLNLSEKQEQILESIYAEKTK